MTFCVFVGLAVAVAALRPDFVFELMPPVVAVMPIIDASDEPRRAAMAGASPTA